MSKERFIADTEELLEDYADGKVTRHEAASWLYRNGWRTDEIGAELNRIDEEAGRIQLEPAGEIPGETQ